jgi:type VI secretion system protein ImpH
MRAAWRGLKSAQLRYIRITPAFMGFGQQRRCRRTTRNASPRTRCTRRTRAARFLDTFSNRALALFYRRGASTGWS